MTAGNWKNYQNQNIPITSKRIAKEFGTHIVTYENEVDQISIIKHKAS